MFESIILTLAICKLFFGGTPEIQNDLPILKIGEVVFNIEIADSEVMRSQGLSGRSNLPINQGLLFDFPVSGWPGFWMKDMNFAIDIMWIDENWKIVDLTRDFTPKSYPQIIYPKSAVKYVLEVNSGLIDKNNFKIGDEIVFKP